MAFGSDFMASTGIGGKPLYTYQAPKTHNSFLTKLGNLFGKGESIIDKIQNFQLPSIKTESEVKFSSSSLLVIGGVILALFFILKRK